MFKIKEMAVERAKGRRVRAYAIAVPCSVFLLMSGGGMAQSQTQTPQQLAWEILETGLASHSTQDRGAAVRVLGLLRKDPRAREAAEKALQDDKSDVRIAAVTSLGDMGAKEAIPELKDALDDKEPAVVLAAAHSLLSLGNPAGYEVYYAVLTRKRKSGKGLREEQMKILKDPKKMAVFGFEQGIGYIPFAEIGWTAWKTLTQDDVSPVRAAAARELANDPDPHSAEALASAISDKSWVVRAAALNAIGRRGDPALLSEILPAMSDDKAEVRDTAAAAVLRLSAEGEARKRRKK